jgi:hypothetical protein
MNHEVERYVGEIRELRAAKERLVKAEEVITFYSDSKNWEMNSSATKSITITEIDHEPNNGKWAGKNQGKGSSVGGKKAREYLQQRDEK